jgi:hypothetical protein
MSRVSWTRCHVTRIGGLCLVAKGSDKSFLVASYFNSSNNILLIWKAERKGIRSHEWSSMMLSLVRRNLVCKIPWNEHNLVKGEMTTHEYKDCPFNGDNVTCPRWWPRKWPAHYVIVNTMATWPFIWKLSGKTNFLVLLLALRMGGGKQYPK